MKPYGQQEPLTRRIHSILRDYPAGTQIMKELLQNADDARASDVTFMLDLRVGTDPRLSPRMANPSLFCYNNKPFAEKDFVSLQNLGQSCKRQDTSSTGRFGIGFNSVYNLTDYVAFVTGSSFVLFDPHRHFVQGDTGERMDFVEDRIDSLSPDKSALASCFKLFGNDMQSPFSGTLFRFPLRSAALAQHSEISSAHYDGPSMLRLFRRFITEASNDCLFLKFVRRISLEVWEDKAEQPATLFKVEVSARGPDLANRSRVALESLAATAEYSYTLTLRQTVHDALAERLFSEVPLGTDQPEAQALPRGESEQEWLFAAYCDVDGPARQYVEDIQETKDTSDLRMVPWACVAWPRPHATREAAVIEGRAYCFLPLPVITGLLPHLNSFWELSSNRRDLWKGDNMGSEASKIRGQWNTILKQHVVAPALLHLYAQIKERYLDTGAITAEQYFEDWPTFNAAESEWRDVVTSFYSLLWSSPLRLIQTQGNRWVQCGQVMEADQAFSDARHVTQYLVSQGQQIFPAGGVWQEIIHSFRATGLQLSQVTPQLLRDVLRESDPSTISLDLEHSLLSYCLVDGSPDLVGLPLVPVGRGGTACFGALNDEPILFLVSKSQFNLLQEQAGERLIAVLPSDSRRELFEDIARQKSTNVHMMDHSMMAELLGQTAFTGVQPGVHQASWHREGGLSAQFVSALWDYLVEVSWQDDAAPLERWPVVATQSATLVSLSEAGRASLLDASAADLPSNVQRAFEKLGCRFLDHTICRGKLPQGRWTLMQAEAPNLLRAAGNASGDRLAELSGRLSPDEKRALFQFLVNNAPTGAVEKTILQSLAIYPLCGQGDDKFGSAIRRAMAELGTPEAVLDDHFIKVDGLDQQAHFLSHSVGVVKVKKHAVYTRHIFPAIRNRKLSPVQVEVVMLQVLKELLALADEDPTIIAQVTSLPFLRVATHSGRGSSGALLAPSDALDPRCEVLARLFGTQALFPHGSFASPTVLPRLLEVGLQSQLTPRLFLLAVGAITRENDVVKAEELFHTLTCDRDDLLQGGDWEAAFAQVAQKPWIPSRKLTLQQMFLQVNGGSVKLSAPHETWPKSLAPLIGTASITAEHDDVGMHLSSLLGWDAPLPLPLVLAHWERIIDFTAKLKALEEGPISVDVCQRIKHTTMKIYDHLDRYIGLKQLDRPLPEPGVWTGTEFVSVHRVAWDAPEVDTAGVLMPIPSSLRLRECLAKAMKIKPAFTAEDYLQVLVAICDNGELAKVDTVELLLLHLAKQPRGWLVAHGSKLRAPDIERTAYWPLEELAYADSTKVLKTLRGIDAPVKLISERIPRDIAAKLGAKSLSHLLQDEFSELIGVEYGQEEKLTSRIANILHNYSHEDLLKELVQNAEDAGATEFCLLLDKKTHASNLLFNPMMAQFQGPSLLIYNNRTLLEHDIANISRLGDSHKLESYQKIGRFGVGLNTAYHYADLLQFLSGETLLILDPHAKHVTGASEKKPGRRYKFTGRLFDSFQDQLSPFQSVINDDPSSFFLTDPHQPFEGTLLRLPLRNKDAASRLSKNHWIGEWQGFKKIEEMLDHFKNEALSCLLFLRHLQQVAIYVRETDGRVRLHSMAKRTAPALSVPKLLESATQQFTEKLPHPSSAILQPCADELSFTLTDRSGKQEKQRWLLAGCVGAGMWSMALQEQTRDSGKVRMLPWASLAVPLTGTQEQGLVPAPVQGRAFCFLPLPTATGLPVHINGFFEMASDRRALWQNQFSEQDVRQKWNRLVFQEGVARAYVHLMISLRDRYSFPKDSAKNQSLFESLMRLLPASTVHGAQEALVQPLLEAVSGEALFFSKGCCQWKRLSEVVQAPRLSPGLLKAFVDYGLPFVELARAASLALSPITEQFVRSFFAQVFQRSARAQDFAWVRSSENFLDEIWRYCLSDSPKDQALDFLLYWPVPVYGDSNPHTQRLGTCELIIIPDPKVLQLLPAQKHKHCLVLEFVQKRWASLSNNPKALTQLRVVPFSPSVLARQRSTQEWGQLSLQALLATWQYLDQQDQRTYNLTRESTEELLREFSRVPIIPIVGGAREVLSRSAHVLGDVPSAMRQQLAPVLDKLGVPILDAGFRNVRCLARLISSSTADGVLEALRCAPSSSFCRLDPDDRATLLSMVSRAQDREGVLSLPLFERMDGTWISAASSPLTVLDPVIPPELVPSGSAYYKWKPELYRNVPCTLIDTKTFFAQSVLPRFGHFAPKEKLKVMRFLKQQDLARRLVDQLKTIAWVYTSDGGWYQPSRLLDPQDQLLRRFFAANGFPGEPFAGEEWAGLLRQCGLRQLNAELVRQCALHITQAGLPQSEKYSMASALWKRVVDDNHNDQLQVLTQHAIFPAHPLSESISNKACDPSLLPLVKVGDCAQWTHRDLVWTVSSVAPNDAEWTRYYSRVRSQLAGPEASLVLQHLKTLASMAATRRPEWDTALILRIYEYLRNNVKRLPHPPPEALRNEPLIYHPADQSFRPPALTFSKLKKNYAPSLYKLPEVCLPYYDFVVTYLQVAELPSVARCKQILSTLAKSHLRETGGDMVFDRLSPNQVPLVHKLIRVIVMRGEHLDDSFVPTTRGYMVRFGECVTNDVPFLEKCLNMDAFHVLDRKLDRLADRLHVARLSGLIDERRAYASDGPATRHNGTTERLTDRLQSAEFRAALVRIDAARQRIERQPEQEKELARMLADLEHMTVVLVDSLHTTFVRRDTGQDVTKGTHTTPCAVHAETHRIFVSSSLPAYVDTTDLVGRHLSLFLFHEDAAFVSALLRCEPEDMEALLDLHQVPRVTNTLAVPPLPKRVAGGQLMHEDYEALSDVDGDAAASPLSIDEMVAYSLKSIKGKDKREDDEAGTEQAEWCYGIVIEKIDNADTDEPLYKVQIGAKTTTQLARSHLRRFSTRDGTRRRRQLQPRETSGDDQQRLQAALRERLTCPISQDIFVDPVVASDGHTYERTELGAWLLSRTESPVTRQQLRPELYPNLLAKSLADLLPKLE